MIDHCYVSIKILIGGSFWVYHVSILFKHVHVMIECGNTVPQSGFFLLAVGFQSQISPYNDTQICSDFMRTWHGIRDWCESRSFGPVGPMLRWNQHEDPESGLGKYSNVHSFSLLTTVVEAIFSTPTTKLQKVPHPSTIEQRSRTTSCRRPRGPWCLQNSSPYLAQMGGLDVPTEQYWPSKIATQQKKCINPTPKISKNLQKWVRNIWKQIMFRICANLCDPQHSYPTVQRSNATRTRDSCPRWARWYLSASILQPEGFISPGKPCI